MLRANEKLTFQNHCVALFGSASLAKPTLPSVQSSGAPRSLTCGLPTMDMAFLNVRKARQSQRTCARYAQHATCRWDRSTPLTNSRPSGPPLFRASHPVDPRRVSQRLLPQVARASFSKGPPLSTTAARRRRGRRQSDPRRTLSGIASRTPGRVCSKSSPRGTCESICRRSAE